jgi:hypothetical protein
MAEDTFPGPLVGDPRLDRPMLERADFVEVAAFQADGK